MTSRYEIENTMNKWRDQALTDEPIALKIVVGKCLFNIAC